MFGNHNLNCSSSKEVGDRPTVHCEDESLSTVCYPRVADTQVDCTRLSIVYYPRVYNNTQTVCTTMRPDWLIYHTGSPLFI